MCCNKKCSKGHLCSKHQAPWRIWVWIWNNYVVWVYRALYCLGCDKCFPYGEIVDKFVKRNYCNCQHDKLQYRFEPFWYALYLLASKPHDTVPPNYRDYHQVSDKLGKAVDWKLCLFKDFAYGNSPSLGVVGNADIECVKSNRGHGGCTKVKDSKKDLSCPHFVSFEAGVAHIVWR